MGARPHREIGEAYSSRLVPPKKENSESGREKKKNLSSSKRIFICGPRPSSGLVPLFAL